MTAVYPYSGALYINLTNRCPCACVYCIKNKWRWKFRGVDLRLKKEPSPSEVLDDISALMAASPKKKYSEAVFCGYGEPFMRFEEMKEIAASLKKSGWRVRVNTTGLGNFLAGRNLLPGLVGIVDAFSVSLNADSPARYAAVNRPAAGEKAFAAALDFVRDAVKLFDDVTVTAVELPGTDIAAVEKIAFGLGAKFRARPYLDDYEDR